MEFLTTTQCLLWGSLFMLFYIYAGYPLLIALLAGFKKRFCTKPVPSGPLPESFSIVMVGHNEAGNLRQKIESILAADPPVPLQEFLAVADGSTDNSREMVETFADPRIQHIQVENRSGKPSGLNMAVPRCRGEVVVLTDARQPLSPNALQLLLERFRDPDIGVVSGELEFKQDKEDSGASQGIGFYWQYEKFIRHREGCVASVPGATGALYAIRAKLFQPVPDNIILDDVAIPMQAVMQGARCVFEPGALAFDRPSVSSQKENVRKRRTLAGNLQLLKYYPRLLVPVLNPIWFQFVSHKLLRLFSPLFLLVALGGNINLLGTGMLYSGLLAGQGVFYAAAMLGMLWQGKARRPRIPAICYMFVSLNVAAALAWWDALSGRHTSVWDRSDKHE